MALEMDFAFLLDPERKLLSIGYSQSDNSLDVNCYDLLASESASRKPVRHRERRRDDAPLVPPRSRCNAGR